MPIRYDRWSRHARRWLPRRVAARATGRYRQFNDTDGQFHQLIVDSAGNQVTSTAYAGMHVVILQARIYLHRKSNSIGSEDTVREHQAILDAYRAGRW